MSCPSSTSIVPPWVLAAPSGICPAELLSSRREVDVWALSHFQAVGFSSQMRSLLPNTVLG